MIIVIRFNLTFRMVRLAIPKVLYSTHAHFIYLRVPYSEKLIKNLGIPYIRMFVIPKIKKGSFDSPKIR